jgi:hypothetical protein
MLIFLRYLGLYPLQFIPNVYSGICNTYRYAFLRLFIDRLYQLLIEAHWYLY